VETARLSHDPRRRRGAVAHELSNISSLKPCTHWGFGWCFELRAPGNLCHLGLRLTLALITTGFLLNKE
jgi:hypothetical protein